MKLAFINLIYDHSLFKGCFFLQASKGSLHRAAVSGQHETVKERLEIGEDVDQSDEVLVCFRLFFNLTLRPASRVGFTFGFFLFIVNNKIGRTV